MGRVADQKFDVELKVRDLLEIALEHRAIAGKPERPAVVARVVGDETMQIRPILPVEARDIGPVQVGKRGFDHNDTSSRLGGTTSATDRPPMRFPERVGYGKSWAYGHTRERRGRA